MDGAFDIVSWSNCTARCDDQNLTWDPEWIWMAGINQTGAPKVGTNGVSITKDGALEIHQVQLRDAGKYRCTVKRIDHSSPGVHFITLIVTGMNCLSMSLLYTKRQKYS